jgi:hypothetical protein
MANVVLFAEFGDLLDIVVDSRCEARRCGLNAQDFTLICVIFQQLFDGFDIGLELVANNERFNDQRPQIGRIYRFQASFLVDPREYDIFLLRHRLTLESEQTYREAHAGRKR